MSGHVTADTAALSATAMSRAAISRGWSSAEKAKRQFIAMEKQLELLWMICESSTKTLQDSCVSSTAEKSPKVHAA